jgi:hypothetical protein
MKEWKQVNSIKEYLCSLNEQDQNKKHNIIVKYDSDNHLQLAICQEDISRFKKWAKTKNDMQMVAMLVKSGRFDNHSFKNHQIPDIFLATREFVLDILSSNGRLLCYASDDLKNDEQVVSRAISKNGLALEYASDALKNNLDMVYYAVQCHGSSLQYASKPLQRNKKVILAALKQNKAAYKHVPKECKNDIDVLAQLLSGTSLRALKLSKQFIQDNRFALLQAQLLSSRALPIKYTVHTKM